MRLPKRGFAAASMTQMTSGLSNAAHDIIFKEQLFSMGHRKSLDMIHCWGPGLWGYCIHLKIGSEMETRLDILT